MVEIFKMKPGTHPSKLSELPKPPKELWFRGVLPAASLKMITIIGSRNHSPYGTSVVKNLVAGLAGFDVCIVSGLAIGIDTLAHEAALEHNIPTVAFPGSGLAPNVLYPASNRDLAKRILDSGGCLISEFPPETTGASWTFPVRNRLMAGIADIVVVIEATADSGTLITAGLANECGTTVGAVPGGIFSEFSRGSNELLRQGACVICNANDILREIGLEHSVAISNNTALLESATAEELRIYHLLKLPLSRSDIARQLQTEVSEINILLSMMELRGLVTEKFGLVGRVDFLS